MDGGGVERKRAGSTFVAATPISVGGDCARAMRDRFSLRDFRAGNRAFVLLLVTAIGLIVVPEAINHLIVKHTPDIGIEEALATSETPIAGLTRWAGSGILLVLSSLIVLMRGHPNRDITWLLAFLIALNLAYVIGPEALTPPDIPKILLANVVLVAIWNTGASISELKWIPILLTGVGAYSIIGGLVIPEYMMYNMDSRKSLIAGWELAGPFGQSNALGMYCAISFSLIPLIPKNRWRVLCGVILFATMVASATRTAVIAAGVVLLWWAICRLRSIFSIRLAGTVLASAAVAAALVIPLLDWNREAFTERPIIWSQALQLWHQSPLFGMGFNWFLTSGPFTAETAVWANAGTGHNILVDELVKYGLVGFATVLPIWIGSIFAARALRVTREQVACFGYIIVFFVIASTEAVWDLWPNIQQFPTSGLIFATLLMARPDDATPQRA